MPLVIAIVSGIVCALFASGCRRAAAASFVPTLQVQLAARQVTRSNLPAQRKAPWDATVIAWLRFTPKIAASSIPMRAEFDVELDVIPCEAEDLTCLEEFAEGERSTTRMLGELE
ncbi:MAG: hypothetical protein QM778_33915 [Myxococcales bacterium]